MKHVFYLEDDLNVQETMLTMLELELPSDCVVSAFTHLDSLQCALRKLPPHLVISDLNVPDAGPSQILEALEKEVPASVPIILASGDVDSMRAISGNRRFSLFPKGTNLQVLFGLLEQFRQSTPARA